MPDGRVRFSQPALDVQAHLVVSDEVLLVPAKRVGHVRLREPCIRMVVVAFAPQQAVDPLQQFIGDRRVFQAFAMPGQDVVKIRSVCILQFLKRLLEHFQGAGFRQLHPQMAVDRVPGEQDAVLAA